MDIAANHPKEDAGLHLRRLRGAPVGHYVREFASLWEGLESSPDFYVLDVKFTPFAHDAGRIYLKFHIKGLAGGITQSAEEFQIRQWVTAYAKKHSMWMDLRARYLKPKPAEQNGLFVVQTVLQQEVVVCHLRAGTASPLPPKRAESATYRTWRSADYPERVAHAG